MCAKPSAFSAHSIEMENIDRQATTNVCVYIITLLIEWECGAEGYLPIVDRIRWIYDTENWYNCFPYE